MFNSVFWVASQLIYAIAITGDRETVTGLEPVDSRMSDHVSALVRLPRVERMLDT